MPAQRSWPPRALHTTRPGNRCTKMARLRAPRARRAMLPASRCIEMVPCRARRAHPDMHPAALPRAWAATLIHARGRVNGPGSFLCTIDTEEPRALRCFFYCDFRPSGSSGSISLPGRLTSRGWERVATDGRCCDGPSLLVPAEQVQSRLRNSRADSRFWPPHLWLDKTGGNVTPKRRRGSPYGRPRVADHLTAMQTPTTSCYW